MVRFETPAAHRAQMDFAALRLPCGRRYALTVVIRRSRSQWATSTMQEEERQAKGRTAMSRGHAARGGLDGYYAPLVNDWGIKEAVPAPLGPMQLLVAGSPEEVPLILGCFLGPAQLTIPAVCYATGLLIWNRSTRPCIRPTAKAGRREH